MNYVDAELRVAAKVARVQFREINADEAHGSRRQSAHGRVSSWSSWFSLSAASFPGPLRGACKMAGAGLRQSSRTPDEPPPALRSAAASASGRWARIGKSPPAPSSEDG